jgi:hypothetical protein
VGVVRYRGFCACMLCYVMLLSFGAGDWTQVFKYAKRMFHLWATFLVPNYGKFLREEFNWSAWVGCLLLGRGTGSRGKGYRNGQVFQVMSSTSLHQAGQPAALSSFLFLFFYSFSLFIH